MATRYKGPAIGPAALDTDEITDGAMLTRPYQSSLRTSRPPAEVLDGVAGRPPAGIGIAERGTHYLVLQPRRRHRYGSDIAVGAAIVIVLAVLIATAASPVFIALLPLAGLPAVPLLLDRRPDLAVSAVSDQGGGTLVTVHGEASPELAAAVDDYLGALPDAGTPPATRADQAADATSAPGSPLNR